MQHQFVRLLGICLCAGWLIACGASTAQTPTTPASGDPPAPPVATAVADTALPTLVPPTLAPVSTPKPVDANALQPQAPAGKPAQDVFANITVEQKACLQAAWGDSAFAEITSFARAPAPDEQAAIPACNIMMGAPAGGAPMPGGAPPAAGGHKPNNDQTFVTYSADGVQWSAGVLLAESASVPEVIYTSKGEYWAYWVDFSMATGPNTEQIGVAYSTDGQTWQKRGMATFAGGEAMTPVDPDAFELSDGRLRMYFYDIADRSAHKIYSAVSSDGVNFTLEPGIRFQADQIYDPNVVLLPDGRYRMYLNHTDIWSATSDDGLTFVKDDGIRVETGAVPGAVVLPNGSVRLYVCNQGISVYDSPDGLAFERVAQGVVQAQGILCDPSVAATPNGYIMVYKFAELTNPPKSPPSP
jgi:hypothetical protein